MSSNDRGQVALFIDWDNLAISTAADLGGATPDVKAIVQRAQQYGTVVIAKAYAEWQATSDRLAVYRTGVEPVYAPTFRFEPDTAGQPGRGKSLADPCLVADCVDALHLFPDIGTYVIVSGDKDLIPVVRLAQLRGRRVVVIGPDYVAGVLREMADEFISYRSLVEVAPARPAAEPARRYAPHHVAEEPARRRSAERHPAAALARQEKLAALPTPPAAAAPTPLRPKATVEAPEAAVETAEERGPADDLRSVFNAVVAILQQRRDEGRDRIRATNLKDALMQRMPGFSERKYGFAKFKDLLTAAEKSGLIHVTMAGPVHWISLPGAVEQPPLAAAEAAPVAAMEAVAEVVPAQIEDQRNEMIKFIYDLRDRSRWLTYTYVLTNLISHFGKSLPQAAAESQARATLNYLVQQGILRVDKEPQEVEVGGAKHRVRMCHLNTSHELVAEALGFTPEEGAAGKAELEQVPAEGTAVEAGAPSEAEATEAATIPAAEVSGESAGEEAAARAEVEGAGPSTVESGPLAGAVVGGNGLENEMPGVRAAEESAASAEPATQAAEPAATGGPETAAPRAAVEREAPEEAPAQVAPAETPAEEEGAPLAAAPVEGSRLEQAYAALERVIYEVTSSEKPMVSASTLRARLIEALGSFNERHLGFPRFKDFLVSAQQAGIIRLETRGYVTWVAPPNGRSQAASPVEETE